MLRKLARYVVFLLVGFAVLGGILYAAGLRVVMDGGGGIGLAFTKSAEKRAAEIEKHRAAQRAQSPPPAPAQPSREAAALPSSATAEKPSPAAAGPSFYWTNFRGPEQDGHYRQQPVRTDWGRGLTPLWKQPQRCSSTSWAFLPGGAYSTFRSAGLAGFGFCTRL